MSGVEMSTFGIKIGHFNPRLYNRIYCVIPGVEMSPTISIMQWYPKQVIGEEEYQTLTQLLRTPARVHFISLYLNQRITTQTVS